MAARVGVPVREGRYPFRVDIGHEAGKLVWSRSFGQGREMRSVFSPVGHYPDGFWVERTGAATLELGVAIDDGGWHWIQRRVIWGALTLPAWLGPKTRAYKKETGGRYEFVVAFSVPLLGTVLSYRGLLDMEV